MHYYSKNYQKEHPDDFSWNGINCFGTILLPREFVYDRMITMDPPKHVSYYLTDVDTVHLLQLVYQDTDEIKLTKQDILDDSIILKDWFGTIQHGQEVLEGISDIDWEVM